MPLPSPNRSYICRILNLVGASPGYVSCLFEESDATLWQPWHRDLSSFSASASFNSVDRPFVSGDPIDDTRRVSLI
jgi:hypothetical protein